MTSPDITGQSDRPRPSLFAALSELSLSIDEYTLEFHERRCAGDFARVSVLLDTQDARPGDPDFTRPCTLVSLHGDGEVGIGEDVTYDVADHRALVDSPVEFPLEGNYSFDSFSAALDDVDLFPSGPPTREASRAYRRWAVESAALDLALKQADTNLASALGREYAPVRFLVSTRLGDPPTADRVIQWLDRNPELEFKLDATSGWTNKLIGRLAATEAVRIIDLKGQYSGTMVDQSADPDLYRRILEAFPEAVIEDPILTAETRSMFDGHEERISWDAPITDVASIEALPFAPEWLNIKPSRSGSVETLMNVIKYCLEEGISMYGGGQTELAAGREHLHALASLFYPDAPNDIAPRRYNDPGTVPGLPTSPLSPPVEPRGLEWR